MKARYAIALALLTGAGAGAAAVQALHAQAKPPVIYVAEIDVTDAAGYQRDFAPKSQAAVRASGAKFLVLGGKTTALRGDPPKSRIVIQQWESMEKLMDWYNSPAQKELIAIQDKYAKVRVFAVEGVAP
jgi:uncharacterized protein (DUF1330 family)